MGARKLLVILLSILISLEGKTQNISFFVRTKNSSPQAYAKYLETGHRLSYIEWFLFQNKKKVRSIPSLDEALETAGGNPQASLPLFEKAISELEADLLNDNTREMLLSLFEKLSSLDLPGTIRLHYRERKQNLQQVQTSSNQASPEAESSIHRKDLDLTVSKIRRTPGFEEAIVLLDGYSLLTTWPKGRHQWAVLSNVFEPVIFNGTWSEFQQFVFKLPEPTLLAEGDCSSAKITSPSLNISFEAVIFVSEKCVHQNLNSSVALSQTAPSGHLVQPQQNFESDRNWSWVIPLGIFLGAGLAYGLKDKRVTMRMPHF